MCGHVAPERVLVLCAAEVVLGEGVRAEGVRVDVLVAEDALPHAAVVVPCCAANVSQGAISYKVSRQA